MVNEATSLGAHLVVGAVAIRDQLAHLDQLVALHENFWGAFAQRHPSPGMYEFLRHHWDPWLTRWWSIRAYLGTDQGLSALRRRLALSRSRQEDFAAPGLAPLPDLTDMLASAVHEAARGLSGIRDRAERDGIPMPDLGATRRFVQSDQVGGIFDDISRVAKSAFGAVKGAVSKVASYVRHPPGWFTKAFPLFTMENQRYWAGKLGGSTGEQVYDASVKAVATKYMGPQGPALIEAYSKVTDDAARGNVDAQEILARAPQIAKLAKASREGPEQLQSAVAQTESAVKVSGEARPSYDVPHLGEPNMMLERYRNTAIQAVTSVHRQNPSPVYGYFRRGVQQKIYLFPSGGDARAWFDQRARIEPGYDYMAVFDAANLLAPVVEDVGSAVMHPAVGNWFLPFLLGLPVGALGGYYYRRLQEPPGPLDIPGAPVVPGVSGEPLAPLVEDLGGGEVAASQVGNWFLPFLLGLPAGALGGYYYRRWQEEHPGKVLPWISGEADLWGAPVLGAPWMDGEGLDFVGAVDPDVARRRAWPRTRALIHSAIRDTLNFSNVGDRHWGSPTDAAYLWVLEDDGDAQVAPFTSREAALAYMRERARMPHVAMALFDRTSPHWPNPVGWTKSDDPTYESVIVQQIAKYSAPQAAGEVVGAEPWLSIVGTEPWLSIVGTEPWQSIVGTEPWQSIVGTEPWLSIVGTEPWLSIVGTEPWGPLVGAAVDVLRRQAQILASEVPAPLVIVVRDASNRWRYGKFFLVDAAIEAFSGVTANLGSFTYAALFNKNDPRFPLPFDEVIGEATSVMPGAQPTIHPSLSSAA